MNKEEKEQQEQAIKRLEVINKLIEISRKYDGFNTFIQRSLTILIALVIATGSIYLIIFFIRNIFRI